MNVYPENDKQAPLRILVFSASLRNDSLNKRLAELAASVIVKNGAIADLTDMSAFDCPSYNQDLESDSFYSCRSRRV